MKELDTIIFDDYIDLADHMLEVTNEDHFSCVVMKYDKARQLVKAIACFKEVEIGCIDIADEQWNGYNKEYYVTLATYTDGVYELSVEPAWHEDSEYRKACYFDVDHAIVFVDSDASSAILNHIGNHSKIYEVEMDIDEYDCDECEFREECYGDDEEANEDLKAVIDYIIDKLF